MADVDTLVDFGEGTDPPANESSVSEEKNKAFDIFAQIDESEPPREGEPLDFDDLDPLASNSRVQANPKDAVDFFTTVEYQSPSEPFGPSDGLTNDLLGDLQEPTSTESYTRTTKGDHFDLLGMENGHVTTTTTETYEDADGIHTTSISETSEGGDRVDSPQPSESSDINEGGQQKDKGTLHYMRSRFANREEKQREKITRKPKKLSHGWAKKPQAEEVGPGGEKFLPKEQDFLSFTSFGIDYSKTQIQKKVDDVKQGEGNKLLKPPARQGDRNRSHSPSPVPVNWARVEKVAPPEITKNVRAIFETGQFTDIHKVRKSKVDDLKKIEAGIYENDPVQLEGVVRETDYNAEPEYIREGSTKFIKEKYLNQESSYRKTRIILDEGTGPDCLENEPLVLEGVVRETDAASDADVLKPAITKNVRAIFETGQFNDIHKVRKSEVEDLKKSEAGIYENNPVRLEGVVRETDCNAEPDYIREGTTKFIKQKYLKQESHYRKTRIILAEATGPECLENVPVVLEGVVRESDAASDADVLRTGITKNKILQYINNSQERETRSNRVIDIVEGNTGPDCVENEPVHLEGVVRETDSNLEGEVIQKGFARNVREQFMNRKDEIKSRGPINIREGTGPECVENEPEQRQDVIRESDKINIKSDFIKRGYASSQKEQYLKGSQKQIKKLTVNLKEGKGPQCVENEPVVRDDVVREGDTQAEVIQEGYAKSLKEQYLSQKGKPIKKIAVNLEEDHGATCESEPIVRDDVVREGDAPVETIEAGYAKTLKEKYLNYKGNEIKKTQINLCEADGPDCVENEPEVRSDVVREADRDLQQDTIQQGYAKNLKQQYLNYKGKEVQKVKVNLAEAEGPSCVENEPQVRSDVVREGDRAAESDTVQRGLAQNLKQQYLNYKGREIQKTKVNLQEGQGPDTFENEPEVRTDVVREGDQDIQQDTVQKGTAQSIKQQYLNYKGKEVKKYQVNLKEAEGPECIENTPEVRTDVVRETDYNPQSDSIQKGTAQNVKQQYLNYKGREIKKTAVNLNEAQGPECVENEPEVREGVVRESDYNPQADSIQRGTAQNIKQQYLNYKGREIKKTAVNLKEAQGPECVENEPEVREGVVRESDYNPQADSIQRGTAQNIKQQYLNYKGREIKKTAVNLNEAQGPECVENEPEVREGVVRESDYNPTADTIHRGTAQNIKQQYLNYKGREIKKTTVNFNEAQGPECVENQPEVREGVVRESDYNPEADTIQRGTAQNIKQQYLNYKGREIKKVAVNLNEAQGPECVENQPEVREGVVRESDYNPEADTIHRGTTKNIKNQYLNYQGKQVQKTAINLREAQGPECIENDPVVRTDVIRESDYNPQADTVVRGTAQNIKQQYLNYKGKQVEKTQINLYEAQGPEVLENQPAVRTDVIRESDYNPESDTIHRGIASVAKQQYLNDKGKPVQRTEIEKWENEEPSCYENNPEVRQDVVREVDTRYISPSEEIAAARETKDVYENEPEELEGVLREQDVNPDETQVNLQTGHARNLRSMWANRESELADEEKRKNAEKGQQLIRFTPPREKTPEMIYQPELVSTQKITLGSGGATSPPPTSPPDQNYDSQTNYTQSSTSYSYENGTNVDSYDNTNNNYEDSYQNYSSYNGEAYDGESYSEAYDSFQAPPSTATLNLSQPTTSTATMSFSSGPSPDEQPRRTSVTRLVLKKASAS